MRKFFILKQESLSKEMLTKVWLGKEKTLINNEATLKEVMNQNKISNYRSIDCFREGSLVKLLDKRSRTWNISGGMDKFLGREVIIEECEDKRFRFHGYDGWTFYYSDIQEVLKF